MAIELKPLPPNTQRRSPFRPPVPVESSKCSHEGPGIGASAKPRIQGMATRASTAATGRPDDNPIFLPSSRPARVHGWPPQEHCELLRPAPRWRRPGPSVAFSRRWIRSKREEGPAQAPGRNPNREASGIWRHWPKRTTNVLRTLRFSLPGPPAPRSQDPRVCPGGLSKLVLELTNVSSTSDASVGSWDNKKTIFLAGASPSFWSIPRNSMKSPSGTQLTALHFQEIAVEASWKKLHTVLPKGKKVPKVKFRRNMRNVWRHCQ